MNWQTIDSAPHEGHVFLFAPKEKPQMFVGYWMHSYERWDYVDEALSDNVDLGTHAPVPTHWMPLPDAPK